MTLVFGFNDLETRKEMLIQQIGITETNERVLEWNAEVNRQFNAVMSMFTMRDARWNTMPIYRYKQPSATRAQFVTEHGVARPRIETGYSQIGLPLMRYED